MLQLLSPLVPVTPLRQGHLRSAWDGLLVTQVLLDATAVGSLLAYLEKRPASPRAGVVTSHLLPSLRQEPAVLRALQSICTQVAQVLHKVGLLEQEDEHQVHTAALLMSLRGAQPHTDVGVAPRANRLFWSLCLHDTDTDVLFGNLGQRLPQQQGTLLVFDPCQPHAVVAREHAHFMKSHFPKTRRQFFAGGDFPTAAWGPLGVSQTLSDSAAAERMNVLTALVHQKTCLMKGRRAAHR